MSTLLCTDLSSNHGFQFKIKALNMVVVSKKPEIVSNQDYDLHQRFFFWANFCTLTTKEIKIQCNSYKGFL
jgi:hypothetical protein